MFSWKEYWEENREEINKRRKKKYKENKEVRDRLVLASRDYRNRKKMERKIEVRKKRTAFSKKLKGRELYSIGYLGMMIGRKSSTLRNWIANGILPETPFRYTGDRFYTMEMMEEVKRVVESRKGIIKKADGDLYYEIYRGWEKLGYVFSAIDFMFNLENGKGEKNEKESN